jgi:ABC-2 type transport system permease protein
MGSVMDAFAIMMYRQLKRFVRARSRIIGSIVNPLIWIVFFGLGWSSLFKGQVARALFGGHSYLDFLAPGVVMMAVFTGGFISGVTVLWDKEFGFLKELLVAPSSRAAGIIGRALGDALVTVIQGALILAAVIPLAHGIRPEGIPAVLAAALLAGTAFTSMGIAIALRMSSMEGFHLVVNFMMMPLLFLSGAFFPIDPLPGWMKALAYLNPLTYSVDLARRSLLGAGSINPLLDAAALALSASALLALASLSFSKATLD